jgi:alpha-1,3-mannosyltransferase
MLNILFEPASKKLPWVLILVELFLCLFIIYKVPFTDVDFSTYIEQVRLVKNNGEFDYANLQGKTGPLVYPAGHVYFYWLLDNLVDTQKIIQVQLVFVFLYLASVWLVLTNYQKAKYPTWVLIACCLSRRVHSIFILRCFNDCVCVFLSHLSISLLMNKKFFTGCLVHSLAVSVKMSALLYSPGILFLLLGHFSSWKAVFACLFIGCVAPQLILSLPFLLKSPVAYLTRSFDLSRIFEHRNSSNWNFIPESIFVSKWFSASLLLLTAVCMSFLWVKVWKKSSLKSKAKYPKSCLTVLHASKFMGVVLSRSMHAQFYVWHFWLVPGLVSESKFFGFSGIDKAISLTLIFLLEIGFNRFPPTFWNSLMIQSTQITLLYGFYRSSCRTSKKSKLKRI